MFLLLSMVFIVLLITSVVMVLASFLSKKMITDREKNSPFECGFDPKGSARWPFSLRFFLIAVIFLIFDVEITLLMPLVYGIFYSSPLSYSVASLFFLVILFMGLVHEWNEGALDWMN
uniref:NADH dehydrogenase subunit 3 n=1 Tax=Latreutes anoplonyx TaxID=3061097 RepID=UPI00286C6286|nr:NADH dehydrogenase subunit 3 [Latreutes anoplonyx]WKF54306.1 NADH dehydrogenase subunit 3 [Latreutes anoplonyx]